MRQALYNIITDPDYNWLVGTVLRPLIVLFILFIIFFHIL